MNAAQNAAAADTQGVKVCVRVRPMSTTEVEQGCDKAFETDASSITLGPKTYMFDNVFDASRSQDDVFTHSAAALLDGFFEGYNATVFAYGQTGSGKTYTMGVEHDGVISHVVDDVFSRSRKLDTDKMTTVVLTMSYLEIFNEEVFDLLAPTASTSLSVRDDIKRGIVVAGLSEHVVRSTEEVNQLLIQGARRRATASTGMNDTSSRSHAICTLSMHQQPAEDSAKFSKFHLVDLAGSERAKRTLATGDRFKEGVHINQALLTLGKVITALSEKKSFVPYRESKLTRLLQDSLGGNSKTVMIACVSPADSNYEETTSTLRYAERTRCIQNKAVINKDPGACEIKYLRQQVELLQLQLLQAKSMLHAPVVASSAGSSTTSQTLPPASVVELTRMKEEVALLRQAKDQWKSIAQHQQGDEAALHQAVEMDMQADGVMNTSADLANVERVIEEKEAMMALLNNVDEGQIGAELEALVKQYEDKIQMLQTPTKKSQLAVATAAQTEVRRLQRLHQQGQLKISSLQVELTSMKHLQASLQRKLKAEVGNAQKEQRRQSLAIMQLQRKDSKKQVEIQKLSQLHAQQNTLLKRKSEELAKLHASKRFKPNEAPALTTDAAAQLVDEVVDVEMTILGAKAAIKVEIEERIELAKALRRTPPGPEKQKVDLQLADKNAVIRKLQQKLDLVEKHHRSTGGTASQLCPSSVMSCHKVIQALLATAVAAKKRSSELVEVQKQLTQTEEQLVEKRATVDSLAAEVKRLGVELESRPPKKERPKPKTEVEEEDIPSESDDDDDDGGEYDDDSDYTEDRAARGRSSSGRKDKTKAAAATVTPGDVVVADCCQCNGKCATKACACRARLGRCGDKCSCKAHKCVNRSGVAAGNGESDNILQELCGPNHDLLLQDIASPAPLKTPLLSPFGSRVVDKENTGVHVLVTPPPPMVQSSKPRATKKGLTRGLQAPSSSAADGGLPNMKKLYDPTSSFSVNPTSSMSLAAQLQML